MASANAKSSVTPVRVRKSDDGKPAATCSAFQPAANVPIRQAKAIAATTTFSFVAIDSAMAIRRAMSERIAGFTPAAGWGACVRCAVV